MEENFNKEEYERLYNLKDYKGAAEYLLNHPTTPDKQPQLNATIRELERKHYQQQSILENSTQSQRDAFYFIKGIDNNDEEIPSKYSSSGNSNRYGDVYVNTINNLKNSHGEHYSEFAITLPSYNNDDSELSIFLDKLNIDESQAKNYGLDIIRWPEDGITFVYCKTDNKNIESIISSFNDVQSYIDNTYKTNTTKNDEKKNELWEKAKQKYKDAGGKVTNNYFDTDNTYLRHYYNTYSRPSIKSVKNKDGERIFELGEDYYTEMNIKNLAHTVSAAREISDNLTNQNKEFIEPTITMPYKSAVHMKLDELRMKNMVDPQTYNNLKNIYDEKVKNSIVGTSLTQYEVYYYDSSNDFRSIAIKDGEFATELLSKANTSERQKLDFALQQAIGENNYTVNLGYRDGQYGAYIQIQPKTTTNTNNDRPYIAMFVPGLMSQHAQYVFERDTNHKAVVQNNDLKRWGYSQPVGAYTLVGYDKQGRAYKTDKTDGSIEYISEEETLDLLNRNNIVNDLVDGFSSMEDMTVDKYEKTLDTYVDKILDAQYPSDSHSDKERNIIKDDIKFNVLVYLRHLGVYNKFIQNSTSELTDYTEY